MIQSVGNKFFKSITETADDLGGRFEIAFTNFSNKITEDADTLVFEFISLSTLIKVVLFMLIILLLLIIFKYVTLGTLFLRNQWFGHHTKSSKMQFFILASPVKVEMDSAAFKKQYDSRTTVLQFETITSDGQFLLKPLKEQSARTKIIPIS